MRPEIVAAGIGGVALLAGYLMRALWMEPRARSVDQRFELLKDILQLGYQPAVGATELLYEAIQRGTETGAAREAVRHSVVTGGHLLTERRETDLNLAANGDLSEEQLLDLILLLRREREHITDEIVAMTAG